MADRVPDEKCPICVDHFVGPVRTNCSHFYCAICFLRYWESKSKRKRVDCPMCRQPVLTVDPCSWDLFPPGGERVLKKLTKYNDIGRVKIHCRQTMIALMAGYLVICSIMCGETMVVPGLY